MRDRDCLHRFLFEGLPIRGHLVHLDASWRALLEHREYPEVVRDIVGESVAASVLLAATIKFKGVLSLQLAGKGPMQLLLAQCTSELGVRALARCQDEVQGGSFVEMASGGNLTVALETDDLSQRYQGIVPLEGHRLADCLRIYFESSEQLPTRLWLHADETGASGMILQRLPSRESDSDTLTAQIADAWRRVQWIGETLQPQELACLSDRNILRRLFGEDDLRLFEPSPVFFRCRCSRERVAAMLRSLGEAESRSIIAERGHVEVHCDFCNREYRFDAVDVEQLFQGHLAEDGGTRLH